MPTPDTITIDRTYIAGRLTAARDALATLLDQIQSHAKHPPTDRLSPDELNGWLMCLTDLCRSSAHTDAWATLGILDLFAKQITGQPDSPSPPQTTAPAPQP